MNGERRKQLKHSRLDTHVEQTHNQLSHRILSQGHCSPFQNNQSLHTLPHVLSSPIYCYHIDERNPTFVPLRTQTRRKCASMPQPVWEGRDEIFLPEIEEEFCPATTMPMVSRKCVLAAPKIGVNVENIVSGRKRTGCTSWNFEWLWKWKTQFLDFIWREPNGVQHFVLPPYIVRRQPLCDIALEHYVVRRRPGYCVYYDHNHHFYFD